MDRRLLSLFLFLLLIFVLLLGGYFVVNIDVEDGELIVDEIINLESIVVYGNSYQIDDGFVDPLDKEIEELDYSEDNGQLGGHEDLECIEAIECGSDFEDDLYCVLDKVYIKVHEFSCDGKCNEDVRSRFVEDCLIGCFEGECIDSYPFDCTFDFDCNFNDFVGDRYCLPDDNVHQYYAFWTCLNPGTEDSACSVELEEKLVDECGTDLSCDGGMCVG